MRSQGCSVRCGSGDTCCRCNPISLCSCDVQLIGKPLVTICVRLELQQAKMMLQPNVETAAPALAVHSRCRRYQLLLGGQCSNVLLAWRQATPVQCARERSSDNRQVSKADTARCVQPDRGKICAYWISALISAADASSGTCMEFRVTALECLAVCTYLHTGAAAVAAAAPVPHTRPYHAARAISNFGG
jgi:hypothetical protein